MASNFEAAPDCSSYGKPGCPGFLIEVPPVEVGAGETVSYCYYFRTPNDATLGIARFASRFEPLTAHIIVYVTVDSSGAPKDRQAPGTLSSADCGFSAVGTTAFRVYAAHAEREQLRMPADDGAGNPLAVELPADAAGFIQMFLVNASETPATANVAFAANALASGSGYTRTATFTTYNGAISIPQFSSDTVATQMCSVPDMVKFWQFSTHTHHYATSAQLSNGATMLLTSSDWENPVVQAYAAPDFYQFQAAEKLTYACTYTNNTNRTVNAGDSEANDENCIAIGYFFPATQPRLCFNSILLPPL